jgi:hypothetical protein
MRRLPAIPCLFILSFFLSGCGEKEPEVSCAEFEKRMSEFSKTALGDATKAGRAKVAGDKKTVCQISSSILSTSRPMFKAASSCKDISAALGLNKLIRTMEELSQESKC